MELTNGEEYTSFCGEELLNECKHRVENERRNLIVSALKSGGCPANNSKCAYLRGGVCVLPKPDLIPLSQYCQNRFVCGSCE